MFFSYLTSVVLLSLAIYGLWQIMRDIWGAYFVPKWENAPKVSLLLVVRNAEQQVEGMLRSLMREADTERVLCDIVVVDYGSEDITPIILDRLAMECQVLKVIHIAGCGRPVAEGVSFCQGEVVYVLDFVHRLRCDQFTAAINSLVRKI